MEGIGQTIMVTPKSIRKKRTQKKKPGLPLPNYLFSEGEVPVVCHCVYDGTSFMVHGATDIRILYYNGSFGRSTLTLRTPLNSNNAQYQQQPYFQKSQQGAKVFVIEDYKVPINTVSTGGSDGEPVRKKSKMSPKDEEVTSEVTNEVTSEASNGTSPEGKEEEGQSLRVILEGDGRKSSNVDEEEKLELMPEEVIFLTFAAGSLKVESEEGENLGYERLWDLIVSKNPEFPLFYAVYHYFRSKNWVPKSGKNYGGDYVLYETGPEFYHSLYIVHILGLPSRPRPLFLEICALQRCASQASKYALFCEVTKPNNFIPASPKSIFELNIQEMPVYRWAPHLYDK
ncbi:unnamed protein product [Allacma fusca]|uniref:tRNA intron endonuclease catalytic domain-containing protein n=1 Tax=Allacma fusca TaxID=39272 RepID=A0A8J2L298_9HEXA|nr:unnamed protein product [Allacma fusca]